MSASNVGDVTSLTDGVSTQSAGGNIQVVSLSGGVSTMSSSGATTCYKKKTCSEGGYYSSVPTDQKCSSKRYNGYTCYYSCSYKTCTDYNSSYKSSIPSGQTCTKVTPRSGLTCYKDCKPSECTYYSASITPSQLSNGSYSLYVDVNSGKALSYDVNITIRGKFGSCNVNRTVTIKAGETRVHGEGETCNPSDPNAQPKVESYYVSPSSAECSGTD